MFLFRQASIQVFSGKKSIKMFKSKKKLTLLHTPMTYNTSELNFPKINIMRKNLSWMLATAITITILII